MVANASYVNILLLKTYTERKKEENSQLSETRPEQGHLRMKSNELKWWCFCLVLNKCFGKMELFRTNKKPGTKQISSINIFICMYNKSLFISLKSAFASTLHIVLFSFNLSAVIFSFICMLVLWLWACLCYSQSKWFYMVHFWYIFITMNLTGKVLNKEGLDQKCLILKWLLCMVTWWNPSWCKTGIVHLLWLKKIISNFKAV